MNATQVLQLAGPLFAIVRNRRGRGYDEVDLISVHAVPVNDHLLMNTRNADGAP